MQDQIVHIDLATLPEAYTTRLADGRMHQELQPVYSLLAPGSYGVGAGITYFEEGEIVVAPNTIPNMSMQPLNKAAGAVFNEWIASLPMEGGITVSMEELVEAATMLEGSDDLKKIGPSRVPAFVYRFACEMKAKREGKRRQQQSVDPQFGRVGPKTAPPLLGAEVKDPMNNFVRDRKPMPGALQRAGQAA